jgi:hypothetical protein
MGMTLDEANPAQKQFLEMVRQDPDKGEQWIKMLDAAAAGMAVIVSAREISDELAKQMTKVVAAGITDMTNRLYPCPDSDKNPRGIELRTDVVTFMKLDGNLIPGTSRWDEKTRQIVVEAQS